MWDCKGPARWVVLSPLYREGIQGLEDAELVLRALHQRAKKQGFKPRSGLFYPSPRPPWTNTCGNLKNESMH